MDRENRQGKMPEAISMEEYLVKRRKSKEEDSNKKKHEAQESSSVWMLREVYI